MYGGDNIKHTCVLRKEPTSLDVLPTANFCKMKLCSVRELVLACQWHHGTALYIRSWKRLRTERARHAALCRGLAWHPYSPLKYYWDSMQLLFMFTTFLYMPVQVFHNCPNPYDPLILFTDLLVFLNLCTRFVTGYVDANHKTIILEPKKIAKHYLKTYFITDLISSMPLQVITLYEDCEYPANTIMFVVKLLRIITAKEQWKNVMGQFQLSYIKYTCITVLLQLLMFTHWMTYLHYQIPALCYHVVPMNDSLMVWFKRINMVLLKPKSTIQRYTTNLFYACGLCIGAGKYNALDHHLAPELIMSASIGIAGLLFIAYCLSTLLRLAIYTQFESYLFNGRYKQLEEYMIFMRLPKFLQKKIKMYINYKFNGHYYHEEAILNTITEQIRQDINMHCCKRLVMNVPLFQDMPVALTNAIVFSLQQVFFMPGEIVVKYGEDGSSLLLISSGTVAVINGDGREVAHMRDGAFFGENSLLQTGMLRTSTIIALEITEIFRLDSKDFYSCLQPYPHLKRRVEEVSVNRRGSPSRIRRY